MGTYAALIGASIWSDALNVGVTRELSGPALAALEGLPLTERQSLLSQLCSGAVDQEYFAQVSQAIPLLLVTLGIETGFFRRGLREPAQRAATIATVTMLCVGLMSALSTLPLSGSGCGNVLPAWHEYFGLVFTLQAVFVALTTLIWVLAINTPDEETPVR